MQFSFARQTYANGYDHKKNIDPRIPIASHIGWIKSTNTQTEFSIPEPDNYNHAILTDRPVECPLDFVESQVWYRDLKHRGWWSVYYVPQGRLMEFRAWLFKMSVDTYWYTPRYVDLRERRPLLWAKRNQAEFTNNELLYAQGYYENLRVKYFGDKDTMFQSRVGVPRENLPNTFLVED